MKKDYRKIISIVCLVIALIGIIGVIADSVQKDKNGEIYEELQNDVKNEQENDDNNDQEQENDEKEEPVDFAALKEINEDIYAWIDIADTNIHYPIVQSATDDTYYLEHTIEGVKGYPGSIYTEKVNAKDFTDFNTLIYGHDMKDGTMFKDLHKFKDKEFFDTHDTVTIQTETEVKTYRVYAAVIYDNRHILYKYDNDNIADRKAFIQSLKDIGESGSFFREDMTIDENSKLITLSTCITGQSSKRYIVVAAEIAAEISE